MAIPSKRKIGGNGTHRAPGCKAVREAWQSRVPPNLYY